MDKLYSLFGKISTANGAKYYVEQQLAKMQVHYMNRSIIKLGLGRHNNKYKRALTDMLNKIFKEYETLIQADKYGWVKVEKKLYCIPITKKKSIVLNIDGANIDETSRLVEGQDIFLGIFPPLAGLEVLLKPYTKNRKNRRLIKGQGIKSTITNAIGRITNTAQSYMSNLEYWVLQIEALEQDLSIL